MMANDFFAASLFQEEAVASLFSARTILNHALAYEVAAAKAMASSGMIDRIHADAIVEKAASFRPQLEQIAAGQLRDGVIVPEFVGQLRRHVAGEAAEFLHSGLTSQDVLDTALVLSFREALTILEGRIANVAKALGVLDQQFGAASLMARTRMQAAMPITAHDRLSNWQRPLLRLKADLESHRENALALQFGGPVGTRNGFDGKEDVFAKALAKDLSLVDPGSAWHTDRVSFSRLAELVSHLTAQLGKIGQDVSLMAQQGVEEIRLGGGGGSSAMAHKKNPVKAELLIALARFNATQIAGVHHSLMHEQERSGSAWMLEWMILPQMLCVAAKSLAVGEKLLLEVEAIGAE
ncbi:3-carboxy-cis,cis-muconate cycloisomerase [Pseudovibrio sp. SPO723]|uniref:3-carboxy-cis,cis-muconate cycloisomerase n=1 Tax=Nesiotobacter zosterae TaxID=392721 RepID=UPI0029C1D9BF|nr:3-carboxy-cis,cis-muconate cycloisomerase [Pseudovibrio sp. SPO723]MDX5595196.1 3-carboxy-cis,cis-muconate cycloisomerase [Pseudovibrio sp. SPO723]